MGETTFLQVANYQYPSEACLFKGRLESEGIKVFVQNENTINSNPLLSNALGGVKLFVRKEDFVKSKQILDTIPEYCVDDDGRLVCCPNCSAQKIQIFTTIKDVKSFFAFFCAALLTVPMPFYVKHKYKCESCKFEF